MSEGDGRLFESDILNNWATGLLTIAIVSGFIFIIYKFIGVLIWGVPEAIKSVNKFPKEFLFGILIIIAVITVPYVVGKYINKAMREAEDEDENIYY